MRRFLLALCAITMVFLAMGAIPLKQSTSCFVMLGPFVDETTGKDAEAGLTISQGDVKLSKNGGWFAQKNDATACTVDANSPGAGAYYRCPLNTTDTATAGSLTIAVHESGALPVRHEFVVLPANQYGGVVDGSDALQVDIVEVDSNSTSSDNMELAFGGDGYGFTGCTMPTVTNVTNDVNTTVTGTVDANVVTVLGELPLSAADIQTECEEALIAKGLDHLFTAAVTGTDVTDNSFAAKLVSKSSTADYDDYVNTTESLQALRDRGDTAWITATTVNLGTDQSTVTIGTVNSASSCTVTSFSQGALAKFANTDSGETEYVDGSIVDLISDRDSGSIADAIWDELISDHDDTQYTAGWYFKRIVDIMPFE